MWKLATLELIASSPSHLIKLTSLQNFSLKMALHELQSKLNSLSLSALKIMLLIAELEAPLF